MPIRSLAATVTTLCLSSVATLGVESTLQLQLSTTGDFEQRTVQYDCGTETTLGVTYLNAAPNFIALLTPPDGTDPLVFAAVQSGSGVRYVAAQWLWLTQGPEASLYDAELGEDGDPVLSCSEINNTP